MVDNNNHLHIVCQVNSAYSINTDSLDYFWNDSLFNQMFDIYETNTGWDAYLIDTIQTEPVYGGISPWSGGSGSNGLTWSGRIQAGMNQNRDIMFYTWIDTDPTIDQNNTFPNIICKAWDMTNSKEAGPWNFTPYGTPYSGDNYWMFAGDKIFENGNCYQVPVTTTGSATPGDDGTGPANHFFVQGVGFCDADFYPLGNNELKGNDYFGVSQNVPNPASGITAISVNLKKNAQVKIDVSNILGQQVLSIPVQNMSRGINNFNLNVSMLNAGIYFYTVTVGNEKVTRKMIVE